MGRPHALSFPPRESIRGRRSELARLARLVVGRETDSIALVGPGGSGKSTLAAALGHRISRHFPGGIHWFRVGAWSTATLLAMLAIRLGTSRHRVVPGLIGHLKRRGRSFMVLDNHEDDHAVADLLEALRPADVSWVLTARRCLLSGVTVYPVTPPLVLAGRSPYPSVKSLNGLLRYNPLALSVADALVHDGVFSEADLETHLRRRGVGRIQVIADEDDLPEVRALVELAVDRLSPAGRRMLGVLAHAGGDHVDRKSLLALARARRGAAVLDQLVRWRLTQEPFAERYALHATVRRVLRDRTPARPGLLFGHYLALLEGDPDRLDAEQTHLFAAMDHAAEDGSLQDRVRLARLLRALGI